jgi:transposase
MSTHNAIPFNLPGFETDAIHMVDDMVLIKAHATGKTATCPDCQKESSRVHSYYTRVPSDLACIGSAVQLELQVRRFRCLNAACPRKTFAERLPEVVPVYARRTKRVIETLRRVSFALGGEGGARIAQVFQIFISPDTLLRMIRSTDLETGSTPNALGMDDWALKKGHDYGTILVDLEKHQVVDLLPDREAETVAAWLEAHPGVEIITRDRAGTYIEGATKGALDAIQIADRWHLLKNLGEAVQKMLEKHPADLRKAAKHVHEHTAAVPVVDIARETDQIVDEKPPTRRELLFEKVMQLANQGHSKRAIARQLHLDWRTVTRYIAAGELPKHLAPQNISTVTPYLVYLERRWNEGCQNGKQLWQEIQAQGYTGSYSSVGRAIRRHFRSADGRRVRQTSGNPSPRPLSARQATRLLTRPPEDLTSEQIDYREVLCECCPEAAAMYPFAQRFVKLFEEHQVEALDPWLDDALASSIVQLRNFAAGLKRDYAAVKAALTYEWSNGQAEGQINRLKTIKRQMYGRAKFDLLRQRVLFDDS